METRRLEGNQGGIEIVIDTVTDARDVFSEQHSTHGLLTPTVGGGKIGTGCGPARLFFPQLSTEILVDVAHGLGSFFGLQRVYLFSDALNPF